MILPQHLRNTSPWLSDFGRIFDNAFRRLSAGPQDLRILEDADGWTLELDFPGTSRKELNLEVKESALHLKIEKEGQSPGGYRLPLGKQIEAAEITSELKDGILRVRLPKARAHTETKSIEIL